MKKNSILIVLSGVIYVIIIVLSSLYVITPGVNKLKEGNAIKELTYDEKTKLIDEINSKYINLEKEVNEKYAPSIDDVNKKYDELGVNVKEKYDNLEKEISEKYDKKEKELNNSINNNRVAQNNEFFANGLSKKYYELSDKGMELQKEKSSLNLKEREEINDNEKLESDELRTNENNRISEIDTINENKDSELNRLNEKKTNEINSINNQNIDKDSIKKEGFSKILIGVGIILIPILYLVIVFNKLTHLSNSVKEKWSQIDVLLKQRADLIPNIVETVKGYTKHEKETLSDVTKARNDVIKASTKEEEIETNKNLSNAVSKLMVLQENYPELKANTNFMDLQNSLREIEDNISLYRQQYNSYVLKYKNKLEMFPSNIVADIFNFKPELFFEIDDDDKNNPTIRL